MLSRCPCRIIWANIQVGGRIIKGLKARINIAQGEALENDLQES